MIRPSPLIKAVLLMGTAAALTAAQNTLIRFLGDSGIHPFEIAFFRCVFGLLTAAPLVFWAERTWPRTRAAKPLAASGLFHFTAMICFFTGVTLIPLNESAALTFAGPLFATVGAAIFLGENVRARRWAAIVIGFAGVLVMTRPGTAMFQKEAILAILCAFFYGMGQVFTRRIDPSLPTAVTALWQGGVYSIFYLTLALIFGFGLVAPSGNASLDFLTRAWLLPSLPDFGLMLLAALLSCFQIPLQVAGYRYAESSFVAPFEYTAMIWAVLYGIFIFGDIPDNATIIGASIVAAAGLVMLRFDRKKI